MAKVHITFTWEFNKKEWAEFLKDLSKEDIESKIKFNAWDITHHMNQICRPVLETYRVTE